MSAKTQTLERIGPKRAGQYLDLYKGNRPIRQQNVDRFSALIRNGKFRTTHQGIAFHEDGWLADGQHRLWAVIETQTEIEAWVARGLNDEDVVALDNGLVRTMGDAAYYAGVQVDPVVWSVTRMLVRGVKSAQLPLPFEIVREWYEFYQKGVDFAVTMRAKCQPARKKFTTPMTTAIARAYYGVEQENILLRMFDIVLTGQKIVEADSAATLFRDVWITGRLGGPSDSYFKTCAAIRAFVERRNIKTLQRAEIEVWSLPKLPSGLTYNVKQGMNSARTGRVARAQFLEKHRPEPDL